VGTFRVAARRVSTEREPRFDDQRAKRTTSAAGFTVVELIAVMVIVGILATIAANRFVDVNVFESRGFYESTLTATRYAQKLATSSGCAVGVAITASPAEYAIQRWPAAADCNQPSGAAADVFEPGSSTPLRALAPASVVVGNDLSFYFDRIGRPRAPGGALIGDPAALRVAIGSRVLQVTPETGLVREN
jgi:MSHA pilin protein MshC